MSIVVEDGTGISNANSYCSVAEWKAYWVAAGYDFSSYTDAQIAVALIKATRYVESRFRNKFYGWRQTDVQSISWPRVGVILYWVEQSSTVPVELKNAINEYAKRALTLELQPDPNNTDVTGQIVESSRKKVGPIETALTYAKGGAPITRAYPVADQWLANLMPFGDEVVRN